MNLDKILEKTGAVAGEIANKAADIAEDVIDQGKAKANTAIQKKKIKDLKEELGEYLWTCHVDGCDAEQDKLDGFFKEIQDQYDIIKTIEKELEFKQGEGNK
ncbi:MAG: hypothetical protein MJ145_01460 [Clostridia bacterium]|nr:hypothetical protein [Clostridia bacterium]